MYRGEEVRVWGGYGLEGSTAGIWGWYEGEVKAEGVPVEVGGGLVYGERREGEVWGGRGLGRGWAVGLRYEGEGEYPALRAEGVRYEKGNCG